MTRNRLIIVCLCMIAAGTFAAFSEAASLPDGNECWSQAYKSSLDPVLHCSPSCTETCVEQTYHDPLLGDVAVCNCDDGGNPSRCCQIGVLPGPQGAPTPVGRCSQTQPVCVNYASGCQMLQEIDPKTGETISWAICLPQG
jgi:hypothetical protein